MRSPSQWLLLGVALAAIAARPTIAADLRDLYFGEALYQAYQGQYFDALERLDAELAQHRHLDTPDALRQLDKAGQIESRETPTAAIRDKSNMVLGSIMLQSADYGHAQQAFDRVRLEGPYSNRALLSTGWAEVSARDYEKALVPWGMLIGRDATDAAVQEAKLALPFAYSRLQLYGRAALLYGQALDSFGKELEKVDASVRSIRAGNFLKALVRVESKQET